MKFVRILRRLSARSIARLAKLGLQFPRFVLPTLSATKRCMKISTDLYQRDHYKNGPANAFRHALWNYLIAKACFRLRKNREKVLEWTCKITDWHEEAFPNWELAQQMDLHNNEVGRFLFEKHPAKNELQMVQLLQQMTLSSIKVDSDSDLHKLRYHLIHIADET
ncbi:DUF6973 domain-containing protein [Flagellimonas flava]|uniref:DUF6973 domain-containing protein n=1 Tax=Flagellimonas flava TaxID=570519 RepID=A0A1M5ML85_9FLAO|nr:hypothetical protein [Allomuricauda flava]SHG78031.1 hypothetical protein SAMN04488116_2509 [Allomuricauda flava]